MRPPVLILGVALIVLAVDSVFSQGPTTGATYEYETTAGNGGFNAQPTTVPTGPTTVTGAEFEAPEYEETTLPPTTTTVKPKPKPKKPKRPRKRKRRRKQKPQKPTTNAPTTLAPTTLAPTTLAPTTLAPTTLAPKTLAPTTLAAATLAPTTAAPVPIVKTTVAPKSPNALFPRHSCPKMDVATWENEVVIYNTNCAIIIRMNPRTRRPTVTMQEPYW